MHDASEVPWLTLRAANGLTIPYVGYILLDFEVGGVQLSDKGVVIVKDSCLGSKCGILGMNIISKCWQQVFEGTHPGEAAFRTTNNPTAGEAWAQAFATCRRALVSGPGPYLQGVAKLEPQPPFTLPPEMEVMLWTKVPQGSGHPDCLVMVEDLDDGDREWRVARTLGWLRQGHVAVRLCNPNPFPVQLPLGRPLAAVSQGSSEDVQGRNEMEIGRASCRERV